LDGYNKNDLYLESKLKWNVNNKYLSFLKFHSIYSETTPLFESTHYTSNHFKWQNDLEKEAFLSAKIEAFNRKLGLKLIYSHFAWKSLIYDNELAVPFQLNDWLVGGKAQIQQHLKWKKFHADLNVHYQWTNGDEVIRFPEWYAKGGIYWQGWMFNKAMESVVGMDVSYFSLFYANAFMPATGRFFVQNEKRIGDYPYFDFYFNAKVKKARFFIKLTHLNESLMKNRYYATLHYPMPDKAFYIGLRWQFFD